MLHTREHFTLNADGLYASPLTTYTVLNTAEGSADACSLVLIANDAHGNSIDCGAGSHMSWETLLAELNTFAAADAKLIDLRLEMSDAGWFTPKRVKDGNGWRDADKFEQHATGIASPKTGYSPRSAFSGKYTDSGKYELQENVQDWDLRRMSSTHDTRKQARAAMLEYLNGPHAAADRARAFLRSQTLLNWPAFSLDIDFADLYSGNGPSYEPAQAMRLNAELAAAIAALTPEGARAAAEEARDECFMNGRHA